MPISVQRIIYRKNRFDTSYLLDFLCKKFPYLQKKEWQAAILSGKIKVNAQKQALETILQDKDLITYERSRADEPLVEANFDVLFEDNNIIVVQKGGNLPVSISGRYYQNTLIEILKQKSAQNELYPVHRLDKETSGLIVFAKNLLAAEQLGKLIAAQDHQKTYHAVLNGVMPQAKITVREPLMKNKGQSEIHIRQVCDKSGKPAKTIFRLIATEGNLTFAEITTVSGRTHQIRCHAEFIKLPVLGDKLYGRQDEEFIAYLKTKTPFSYNGLVIKRQVAPR